MYNIAVAQSGGPTCAINASLAGVFRGAADESVIGTVYGALNGISGVIDERFVNLNELLEDEKNYNLLKYTPSTLLGSCRIKLPHYNEDSSCYERIFRVFKRYNIGAFFYIGGNDSMDTVCKLSEYARETGSSIRIIGIPKTIDNDVMATDHTPGFGSAVKFIATSVSEIVRDSSVYNVNSVTIIEIMGRDAGWLTASACVLHKNGEAAPHLIYLPETPFDEERFIRDIRKVQQKHQAVIVAVSEGLKNAEGQYTANGHISETVDVFGHQYLSGLGKYLESIVKSKIGCKVRSVELNVLQRCAGHLSSLTDINEAELIGRSAVRTALEGETGKMMVFSRVSDSPYKIVIETAEIQRTANKEKLFPKEWINEHGNNVSDKALPYFIPLIQGEAAIPMKNGLPEYLVLKQPIPVSR